MVRLKNIKLVEDRIQCDIYPEDSKEKGFLSVNINNTDDIEFCLPKNYEYCKTHIIRAKLEMLKMLKEKNIKKKPYQCGIRTAISPYAEDWYKVRGTGAIINDSKEERVVELHWYQFKNIGKVEFKEKKR